MDRLERGEEEMTFDELYNLALTDLRESKTSSDASRVLTRDNALRLCNEAEREACRRSRCLTDRTTPEICQISVVAGTMAYATDSRIIKIKKAWLADGTPLVRKYTADMDCIPNWETHTGTPFAYVADYETGKIALYPNPDASDTLKLYVSRLPLYAIDQTYTVNDVTTTKDSPEINARFHAALVQWMLWGVRSNDDSEAYDPKKAAVNMAMFEAEFGEKRSARQEVYEDSQPYPEWE